MSGFAGHGRGASVLFPKHIRAEHRALARAAQERRLAARSDRQKIKVLGTAIADAARRRGAVSELDGRQCGLTAEEIERFRDAALAYARRIEPGFDAMLVAP